MSRDIRCQNKSGESSLLKSSEERRQALTAKNDLAPSVGSAEEKKWCRQGPRGILGLERSFCDLRGNVGSGVARSKDRGDVRNDICPSLWEGTGVHLVFPK